MKNFSCKSKYKKRTQIEPPKKRKTGKIGNKASDVSTKRPEQTSINTLYNQWLILCVCMCFCFFLLLTGENKLRALSESDGIKAVSSNIEKYISENKDVAVFFGFENEDAVEVNVTPQEIPEFHYISSTSKEYIENYNSYFYKYTGEIPVVNGKISSTYSFRKNPMWNVYSEEDEYEFHRGVDIAAESGTEIVSYLDGTVVRAALSSDYGYHLIIDHGEGLMTLYAHASKLLCEKGDEVKRGEVIALVGETGRTTGPHLHFEVIENGKNVDPKNYLSALFER